jgi:PAS domain S-box-containing protein
LEGINRNNNSNKQTIIFLESVFGASVDGILITDASQNIIRVNNAFANMVGQKKSDLMETNLFIWLEQFANSAPEQWSILEKRILREKEVQGVEFQREIDGKLIYFSVNASIINEIEISERGVILSIWRDITNRKEHEINLNVINEKLKESEKELREVEKDLRNSEKELWAMNVNMQMSEEKIRASEKKYLNLFENSPFSITLLDMKGIIIDCNDNAEITFGYKREELLGEFITNKFFPKEYVPIVRESFKKMLKGINPEPQEIQIIKKDGTIKWAIMNNSLITVNNEPYIQNITQDISVIKETQQQLLLSEYEARERVKELSCLYGISQILEKPNTTIEEVIYHVLDIIPLAWQFPELTCARILFDEKEYETANFQFSDWKILSTTTINGKILRIEVYYLEDKKFFQEEIDLLKDILYRLKIIIFQKQAEQQILKSEEKYREAYNKANFYKDLFTHDINNILNGVKMSSYLIKEFHDNQKEREELLEIIDKQVKRGEELVSNVRKLSQIEETEISLENIKVDDVMTKAINFLRDSFLDKNIDVQIEAPDKKLHVIANDLLLDIFENILTNAAKYNSNSTIMILIKLSEVKEQDKGYIKIEFIDNGIGVPDANKEVILSKEFKKDNKVRGLGIGLSLVKNLVDIYKGKIWVENRIAEDYTKGSNFIILIPVAN